MTGFVQVCANPLNSAAPKDPMRAVTAGGGEWESNPPETGSLPHTDLKSGRPTGNNSPPEAIS